MPSRSRPWLAVLALLALAGHRAAAEPRAAIAVAISEDRWADATDLARDEADPLAAVLVAYYHALAPRTGPDAPSAAAIETLAAATPDWPNRDLLTHRLAEARAGEAGMPNQAWCAPEAAPSPALLLRCAEAALSAGQTEAAIDTARKAWRSGFDDPVGEANFMRRWGGAISPADQMARFDRLAWRDPAGAARQLARLATADRLEATARLALRRDDRTAAPLLNLLTPAARASPGIMFERARWLRRAGHDADAIALWRADGTAAEAAVPATAKPLFWAERDLLTRRALSANDPQAAYAIASGHRQTAVAQAVDAEFLAGFVALRFLSDPARAGAHFTTLAGLSKSAITQARAAWWLARANAADAAASHAALLRAASWPTTFYGQLAAGPDAVARDPDASPSQALQFIGADVMRAAILLTRWGDFRRAGVFIRQAASRGTPSERALAARLATALDDPYLAVAIAREAGRDGVMLPTAGWPIPPGLPATITQSGPPDVPTLLAIMRQESSFDPAAVSPSGARGLMQLMPATAAETAKSLGEPPPAVAALTADPALNVRLGAAYLRAMLARFGNSLPLAAAAYNAGPGRVASWIAANGDPRSGAIDLVDWIELIPFEETRNYVQRVTENASNYRRRLASSALRADAHQ